MAYVAALRTAVFVLAFSVKLKQNTLKELKKDSKGKLNSLEDILKVFESHPSIEEIKKLSILLKSSLFEM